MPKLTEGMIPVKWNGSNWEKTTENDKDWYSYGTGTNTRKWANVVLSEAQWTGEGNKILNENEPYSQFVWIPRYAYKIMSNYHSSASGNIEVKFVNTLNTDSNGKKYSESYPTVTDAGTESGKMNDYVVHPAFDFGTDKLTGIWVGKYESSFQGAGTTDTSGRSNDPNKIMMIKAGVSSWRNIYITNIYDVCLGMNNNSIYGLNNDDSVVDPHLMKNNEWGAVAYLSKSKYGKSDEEIRINNNKNFITGNGASIDNEPESEVINSYKTVYGQTASTTGNVYGVYDMSGGAQEYVAAYVNNKYITDSDQEQYKIYGKKLVDAEAKYKNVYISNRDDSESANYEYTNPNHPDGNVKQYGDAVWETSGNNNNNDSSWYNDRKHFMFSAYVFLHRGGNYGATRAAGVFNFNGTGPVGYGANGGFRVVVPVLQ